MLQSDTRANSAAVLGFDDRSAVEDADAEGLRLGVDPIEELADELAVAVELAVALAVALALTAG